MAESHSKGYTIADYDHYGRSYANQRRPDPRIMKAIMAELGATKAVVNVGAGTGSYEPTDRYVVALEPSKEMRRQRPKTLPPAMVGAVESIPFDDDSFDAAMAILTIHHWPDLEAGIREVRRVTRGPVVIMTFDPGGHTDFWMKDYLPEMVAVEMARYPRAQQVEYAFGDKCKVIPLTVAKDCTDKFQVALYARPEEFLKVEVRNSQSAWKFLPDGAEARFVEELRRDLDSGEWDARYGHFRELPEIRCQLRLIVFRPIPEGNRPAR